MWWTLAAALVASLTALAIAFLAYPYQKKLDRDLQLKLETRRVYEGFFSAANAYLSALMSAHYRRDPKAPVLQSFDAIYLDLLRHQEGMAFYGSKAVVEQCFRYADCLHIYRSHIRKELDLGGLSREARQVESINQAFLFCQEARRLALAKARSDAFGIGFDEAAQDISGIVRLDGAG